MFDKVMLLYEGRQVYFGSPGTAKAYFEQLGFVCPERATTPDFLTSLTNPSLRTTKSSHISTAPRTAEDFARLWRESPTYQRLLQDIRKFDLEYPMEDHRWNRKGYFPGFLP